MMRIFLLSLVLWSSLVLLTHAASDSVNVNLTVTTGGGSSGSGGGTFVGSDGGTGGGGGGSSGGAGGGSGGAAGGSFIFIDPFDLLPRATSTDPRLARLSLLDFFLFQIGEPTRSFTERNLGRVNGRKYTTIALGYDKVPPVLKTIGLTIFNPFNQAQSVSMVLQADDALAAYTATVAAFSRDGLYPINVHILNYDDQSLKKLSGFLQVAGVGLLGPGPISDLASFVRPLALGAGALAGVSQFLLATSGASSLYDLYLLLARALGAPLGFFGFRRKRRPWGTVYDSVTKRPLDPAYISVRQHGREVASAITDIEGRYSLFLSRGEYELTVNKSHYRFPSQLLQGRTGDELYGNLYFGGPITTGGDEITAVNIPLDPIGFDWNEFTKNQARWFGYFWRAEIAKTRLLNILYAVGLVVAIASAAFLPTWFNLGILVAYLLLYVLQRTKHRLKLVSVRYADTKVTVPFAIVRVFLAGLNHEIKSVVTDELGRFYLLVRPGQYYFTVDAKQSDSTYKRLYQSAPIDLPTGLLTSDILLPTV